MSTNDTGLRVIAVGTVRIALYSMMAGESLTTDSARIMMFMAIG